uniref:NADH-ubiquinone oxidoreductase chain 6 n=1 Tax=Schizonycha sp. SCH01 TaxID=1205579 RepID=A0A0S2MNH3_9SCAR|nr:NADH deshydrogenase subunit 6 [Schizonycha sp. SCH01]
MLSMLLITSFTASMTLIFVTHPLSLGLMLLLQTICTSLIMGFFNINYWYSYILFLIMIGGMLVLFLYMTSVASNEKFAFSVKITIMIFTILVLLIFFFMMMDPYYSNINNLYSNTMPENSNFNLSLIKFLNYPNNNILYTIIIYLLITMIAVVNIVDIKKGPLRHMN